MKIKYNQQADFDWFVNQYDDIYQEYGECYVVIKNCEIISVHSDIASAIDNGKLFYPMGEFSIQYCNGDETGYTEYMGGFIFDDYL